MPLTVVLHTSGTSDKADALPALTFDGSRVVIGRGANCDVRLPDPSVSHRHASIRAKDGEYVLVDEKSANGTYVGGTRLSPNTPRPIKHGELFRVGRVWLEARMDQLPATRDLAFATRDLALALVSQAMRALGEEVSARLRVVEGPDAGVSLALADEGRVYVIGRDATCDLTLADVDVSRAHVNVVRRGGLVLARDLGSKNGALLGEERIASDRDVGWRAGEVLRMGATGIALEEPAVIALAELEAADDEPMDPADVPPPPELDGAPAGKTTGDAPIAATPSAPPAPKRPAGASALRWNGTDLAVMLAALAILGLSLLGLFWLLHG